ncbi:putative hydrolase, alpha/beta fold family [Leishmania infantum JPCM5]|uniref:Hydrolase_-_alpha/beta_fold_family_-_putative n=2 Tax=Leishmania infantum TaxID=5671 RepID=A0A6L0XHX5_LEIIN|nr:putative hydrolase, alpha/beta fold family [Leishmania infantum JPCM5]CAC9503671.1 hydrolase_-_alpha/beta_fold_family_-_putative [Leishmania infantum]CAM69391.1 putative hydrolase, alpha/beta fold family [Leishmania infantum JPCM5]SUZ43331.1 hydrolase_-_alpha/beta_fold_family_-_putative [Leishmania infantum]|eukprot:XP_001470198.1 putative hydrolase, alpha/beta fold family [Leishmania infantum JPCM5]
MSATLPLSSEVAETSEPPTRKSNTSLALSSQARDILGDFEDKFIEVGTCASTGKRVTICYNTFGDPSNPCLLLVQGLGSSLLGYSLRFVQLFVDQGYYVIRYDNRDTGLSTQFDDFDPPALIRLTLPQWMSIRERQPYVLKDIMEDGIGLLTALNIRQAHVFGMSMGGMIVQLMAIHYPERVLSLNILFSHAGGADVVNPSLLHYARFLVKPRSNSAEDRAAHMAWFINYLSQGAYKNNLENVKKYILSTYERNGVGDDRGMQRQAAAVMRAPSRAKGLRKVTCPTLILHGTKDPLIPVANGYRLADLVPNAKLVIFPRLGHDLPVELMKPIADEVLLNMSLVKPS